MNALHHVVIDNLQFMLGTTQSAANPFAVQDAVYAKFRKLATTENIHVTVVLHPRKVGETQTGATVSSSKLCLFQFAHADIEHELSVHSLYGGAKASQEADNILMIQTKRNDQDLFMKYLQVGSQGRLMGRRRGLMVSDFRSPRIDISGISTWAIDCS